MRANRFSTFLSPHRHIVALLSIRLRSRIDFDRESKACSSVFLELEYHHSILLIGGANREQLLTKYYGTNSLQISNTWHESI